MVTHKKYDFRNMHYKGAEGKLIPILQQYQDEEGYLTPEAINSIHLEYGIPITQIYGVATFYSQFRLNPVGKYIIRVCHGTACHVSNAVEITRSIQDYLKIKDGETTEDKLFTLETVSCLGCCSLAPVIMINDDTYGNLEPKDVKKIIREYQKGENQ